MNQFAKLFRPRWQAVQLKSFRGTTRHLPATVLFLLAAVACGADTTARSQEPGSSPGNPETAAVRSEGSGGADSSGQGVLHADPASGCLWLNEEPRAEQILLQGDYRVEFSQSGAVVYESGEKRAVEGEEVILVGGFTAEEGVPGCPVPPEQGTVFIGRGIESARECPTLCPTPAQ